MQETVIFASMYMVLIDLLNLIIHSLALGLRVEWSWALWTIKYYRKERSQSYWYLQVCCSNILFVGSTATNVIKAGQSLLFP